MAAALRSRLWYGAGPRDLPGGGALVVADQLHALLSAR
jgi:hypothetical protein